MPIPIGIWQPMAMTAVGPLLQLELTSELFALVQTNSSHKNPMCLKEEAFHFQVGRKSQRTVTRTVTVANQPSVLWTLI